MGGVHTCFFADIMADVGSKVNKVWSTSGSGARPLDRMNNNEVESRVRREWLGLVLRKDITSASAVLYSYGDDGGESQCNQRD